nr:hypothetical protein [Cupriavidus necator]
MARLLNPALRQTHILPATETLPLICDGTAVPKHHEVDFTLHTKQAL